MVEKNGLANLDGRDLDKISKNMSGQENFISLKEASKISGYSPDYIGQLIRSGKISGKQVYTNVSWMTTAESVLAYKQGKETQKSDKVSLKEYLVSRQRKVRMEVDILFLFFKTFKSVLPILVILVCSFFVLILIAMNYFSDLRTLRNNSSSNSNNSEFSF